jgi:hypothetical protein
MALSAVSGQIECGVKWHGINAEYLRRCVGPQMCARRCLRRSD